MGKTRKMRLVAFLKTGPTAHHHGMWRHPETDNDFLDPAWYEHVARVLEKDEQARKVRLAISAEQEPDKPVTAGEAVLAFTR